MANENAATSAAGAIVQKIMQQKKESSESFSDSLLECLLILSQINGNTFSGDALTSGLPLVQNRLTPQLFIRAAQRAGYSSRIVQRPLEKISKLVLPAVLLLKNNRACILNKILENGNYEIILPDSGGGVEKVSSEQIAEDYLGFVIFLKPFYKFDDRADEYHLASKKSWFWGTLWHYRKIYWHVLIATLLIDIFTLASPLFVMNVYDRVVPNFAVETLWVLAVGVTIVIGFDLLLRTLRGYLIDVAGKKADTILGGTLFQQTLGVELSVKPISSGAFANNLREFEVLRDFFTSASVTTLVDLPFIFLFIAVIWMVGSYIALVPLIGVPIVFAISYFFEVPIRRAVEKAIFASTQKHALLVEAVTSLETIKSLAAESVFQRKWEQCIGIGAKAALHSRFFSSLAINFTAFASQVITIAMVIVGVYLIADNKLTVGGLIACTILEGRILAPLAQIAGLLMRFNQSKIALQGLNKVMELPSERSEEKPFLHRPLFQDSIEFHNVTFKYPGQEIYALKNASFKIKIGEKVGIIGTMGSGKSTIEKLMLKLYPPSEGAIFIDGIDMAQIDPVDLRRGIGYVSQDYALLYGSVHSNISLSRPWASDCEILQAAKIATVDSFVNQHPHGYSMPIGEHGHGLSGGQRQSIAIARAILTNSPILLLDEPTSSIDTATENGIIHNLAHFTQNRTLIVITHKESLLSLVNRLIVIDNGKIMLDGPKNDVLAKMKGIKDKIMENTKQITDSGKPAESAAPSEVPKKIAINLNGYDVAAIKMAQEDVDFVSDSKEAILAKTTPYANLVLYLLIAFSVFFILWAKYSNIDEVTHGVGKVVPFSQVQIIDNLDGGIIQKLNVKEGDIVNVDQQLVQLDRTRFAAQYRETYAKYLALYAMNARLNALIDNKPTITFPEEVMKDPELAKRETEFFNSNKLTLETTLVNLKKSYDLTMKEIGITAPLVKVGVMSQVELLRLEREANDLKSRMDNYKQEFQQNNLNLLTKNRGDLNATRDELTSLHDRTQKTTIQSPVKGIVKQIYSNTVGGTVLPGRPIMEIVPLHDQLIVEVGMQPANIGFIHVGQKAVVKISAFDYSIYGGIPATVTNIAADTNTDQRGNTFYEVTVKTDKNYIDSIKKGRLFIIPGMTATVDIITGNKSVLTYLMKPILKAQDEALRER